MIPLASLAGCSFAPHYQPPVTVAPVAYQEAGPWAPAAPADLSQAGDWWTAFGDRTLDGLEQKIGRDNPTLAGALARYDQATGYLKEARSGLFPHIGVGADIERNRQSDNRPLRGSSQPDYYSADTADGEAGYELDLWGRVRNSVAAGKAETQASADDLADIRLSLEAQLATSYIALRGLDRQSDLLSATVDAFAKADAMTRRRFAGGIATGIETGQSGAELAEAQAQLADVQNARALTQHAIASLVGTPASSFSIASAPVDLTIPVVPIGLPSTLLQRRPDVAAAERRMYAANREIGVAKAAFFPSISLSGQGGFQSAGLPGLFTAPNIFWSVGPSAVLNLFDGGRRRGQLAVTRAAWAQATSNYRGDVLKAFQDVEDGLSQLHHLGDEAAAEDRAVQQASQVEHLSLNRYVKGAVDYLDVVTAQTTALRVRRQAIALDTQRLQASVSLIRAVGGGWQEPASSATAMATPSAAPHS
ncbi:efflux transporter outer membrane subunit [Sphingomonas abietis]|uniref:Efflux transporter outer membrane subunit n=1 Tax=Sphingomonas abietis TaxID=3012344 RepID=A0ABY7NR45_9SPHN|nr:efflux transporter outer membrane subunit [Sphingomonas abietis]WBO23280.1 efflux transporter outer membrane subunit [Sphingomonas abietis]